MRLTLRLLAAIRSDQTQEMTLRSPGGVTAKLKKLSKAPGLTQAKQPQVTSLQTPNRAFEPTAASGLRALAVPSVRRASAAAQRQR